MRYQELCFSAFVLSAAIASNNCSHSSNMPLRHAGSTPKASAPGSVTLPRPDRQDFRQAIIAEGTALVAVQMGCNAFKSCHWSVPRFVRHLICSPAGRPFMLEM